MEHETFFTLLKDPSHWEFEIFLMVIFDGLIGFLVWPRISKFLTHHKTDDERIADLEREIENLKSKI